MTSRPRSSSANRAPAASPRNTSHSDLQVPEDLVLNDVPQYNVSSSSNLLIPLYGIGSPYPILSSASATSRPRARSAAAEPLPSPSYPANNSYRPSTRSGPGAPVMYQPGQRHPGGPDPPRQYVIP